MRVFISTITQYFQLCSSTNEQKNPPKLQFWVLKALHRIYYRQNPSVTWPEIVVCLVLLWQKINKALVGLYQQCQNSSQAELWWILYSSSCIVSPSHERTLPSIRQEILMTHENTSHMSLHKWTMLLRLLCYPQQLFCRPKWNHIIMHLFIRRVETEWGSPLSSGRRAEQEPQCHVSWCLGTAG